MPWKIILKDWSEYEAYKTLHGKNATEFQPEDPWEVSFLMRKIKTQYPSVKSDPDIQQAILSCAAMISNPRNRLLFVQCVLKQLSLL
ncbi:MAG: hypothetical protein EOP56_16545 [Sphingobacteriales bacterium]|nr:MAG: hypothetical protein EOP56_16545 [Sphingobacteriales bacterium]